MKAPNRPLKDSEAALACTFSAALCVILAASTISENPVLQFAFGFVAGFAKGFFGVA